MKSIFLTLTVFCIPAVCTLADSIESCGWSVAFRVVKVGPSPDIPIILDAFMSETAVAVAKEKYFWVDDQDHSVDIIARQVLGSQFVILVPPPLESGHSYRLNNMIKNTCAGVETKEPGPIWTKDFGSLCLNYKSFPETHTFSVSATADSFEPIELQLKAVEITGGVIGLGINLNLTSSQPLTNSPPLLVETNYNNDSRKDYHMYSSPQHTENNGQYILESGLVCDPTSFKLFFLETSEIRIYTIRRDGLHRVAGWRVTLPAPRGVSASRYKRMSEKYERAARNARNSQSHYRREEKTILAYQEMINKGGKLPGKYLKISPLAGDDFPPFTPWAR